MASLTKGERGVASLAIALNANEYGHSPHHFQGMRIPLNIVNTLPQPRKTFDEIEFLAGDIARKNLYNPLTVARFDEEHCCKYLELINLLWGVNFSVGDLVSVMEGEAQVFYLLLAGERRYRSCLYIRDVGCAECQEKFGQGGCYERHFGDLSVDVRACINISPLEAIFIQASENIHMRVPPHEEAKFYNQLFRLIRQANAKYPLSEFSRRLGRSPETIRQAIRFCELPVRFQEYVEKGTVVYGIGVEIARLHAQGNLSEKELEWWVRMAVAGNYKVPQFREMVSKFLFDKEAGQISLFDQEQEKQLRKSGFRWIVGRNFITALHNLIHYLNRVTDLFLEGELGNEDSPFSEKSPVRVFRKLIDVEEKLLPHLRSFLFHEEAERARRVIEEAKGVLSRIDDELQEEIPK